MPSYLFPTIFPALFDLSSSALFRAFSSSSRSSQCYAMNCTRAAQGMPNSVKNAVIALLDIDLRKSKMNFGVQVIHRPGLFAV